MVVTTPAIRHTILHRYQLPPDRVRVIPTYVDTSLFAPAQCEAPGPSRLLYVGRLEQEKNPGVLLDAVEGLKVELLMVGKGSLGEALTRIGKGKDLRWLLVKMDDEEADARRSPVSTEPESVLTGRTVEEVAEEEGG